MADPAVVDSSPLIHLARSHWIVLLQAVSPTLIVPTSVAAEVGARGTEDITAHVLATTPWLHIREVPSMPAPIAAWELGAGEAAVLTWAWSHPGSIAVLDDRLARRCAAAVGVPSYGTVGVVLRAKRQGLVPAARPVLQALQDYGLYLSAPIFRQALAAVDE